MCARFTLTITLDALSDVFHLEMPPGAVPRYNVAPSQEVLAVREGPGGREATLLRWGLIPSWAKDPTIGSKLINARSETVAEKPSFRNPFRERRCLIPADGFYEWQKTNGRQPMRIRMNDKSVFAFAGLWDRWNGPDGPLDTCTLLTTDANDLVRPIHDRMPVIMPKESYDVWLDGTAARDRLEALMAPFPSTLMEAYQVSNAVNNPRNDDPACIEPLLL